MRLGLVAVLPFLILAVPAAAQRQVPDTTFVPKVARPAFTGRHPLVMIDEAHHDQFTMDGLFRGFAGLLRLDGLRVVAGRQPFSAALLETCQVLVVADAVPTVRVAEDAARTSAFRMPECDAVRDWVRAGGALLLIADHAPFASAMDSLARRLGVDQGKGRTVDSRYVDPETENYGCIVFTRAARMLGDHAITRGRDATERVNRVVTFTGQSLKGPPGSSELLRLAPTSWDLPYSPDARRDADAETWRRADTSHVVVTPGAVPAVGRAQAVAFTFGRGRVVVLGDGAMFSAQFAVGVDAQQAGKARLRIGFNRPELDNQQFALNVVRWLARALH
jgi:hypothetical protein